MFSLYGLSSLDGFPRDCPTIFIGFPRYQLASSSRLLGTTAVIGCFLSILFVYKRNILSTVQTVQSPIRRLADTSVAERSEPSSRNTLIGEQPNPWELLHPRDVLSRHRGAELRRRYGRLGGTSLLSPE